jgi:hypothetical protein
LFRVGSDAWSNALFPQFPEVGATAGRGQNDVSHAMEGAVLVAVPVIFAIGLDSMGN